MPDWENQIEADLKWREGEIASLKMLVASAAPKSTRQTSLLRACWAMLYAHYEGFCKFCWDLLLNEIEKQKPKRIDLIEPLAQLSFSKIFKKLNKDKSPKAIWIFCQNDFPSHMKEEISNCQRLETRSNLWPEVAIENNSAIGIKCDAFTEYMRDLKRLVQQRNDIAHGKKLPFDSVKDFQEYEQKTSVVMHALAVEILDCLDQKTYLKKPRNRRQKK